MLVWTAHARKIIIGIACIAWLGLLGAGMWQLLRYAHTPGPAGTAPATWPATSGVSRDLTRYTLVLFLHPQCSCSRATIGELEKIIAHVRDRMAVRVLMYRPSHPVPDWTTSDLERLAERIPGVQVAADDDARRARMFGAIVSGQTLLYTPDGRLAFSGGITIARGHAGDNDGARSVVAAVLNDAPPRRQTPVFGCFLYALT